MGFLVCDESCAELTEGQMKFSRTGPHQSFGTSVAAMLIRKTDVTAL